MRIDFHSALCPLPWWNLACFSWGRCWQLDYAVGLLLEADPLGWALCGSSQKRSHMDCCSLFYCWRRNLHYRLHLCTRPWCPGSMHWPPTSAQLTWTGFVFSRSAWMSSIGQVWKTIVIKADWRWTPYRRRTSGRCLGDRSWVSELLSGSKCSIDQPLWERFRCPFLPRLSYPYACRRAFC